MLALNESVTKKIKPLVTEKVKLRDQTNLDVLTPTHLLHESIS